MDERLSVSEPPINSPIMTRKAPPAWSEVAMRIVQDGPMYAIIALVGVLAIKGQANAQEFVITGLGALLARSWPKAVQVGGAGIVAAFFVLRLAGVALPSLEVEAFARDNTKSEERARDNFARSSVPGTREAVRGPERPGERLVTIDRGR